MRTVYLEIKNVKAKLHEYKKQITPAGIVALDKKIEDILIKMATRHNGHHARLNEIDVNF